MRPAAKSEQMTVENILIFLAVNLQRGLACKVQYGHEEDLPEQIVQGIAVGEWWILHPSFYRQLGSNSLLSYRR